MQEILALLGKEAQLRSKRDLIEKFIREYMPCFAPSQDLKEMFAGYWRNEKRLAIHRLCERERMDKDDVYRILDEYAFTGKEPLREQVFAVMDYKPKLMERKKIYSRVIEELKMIVERFEENTGDIGVGEDPAEYASMTLEDFAHKVGDVEIFFTDEVQLSDQALEIARFSIMLDTPYTQRLASLNAYQVGGELFGRGIINEDLLTAYLRLTAEFQNVLMEFDLDFVGSTRSDKKALLWSFSEAREGSTVLDFALNAWDYSVAIGGPFTGFLAVYPKVADGLDRLKQDIQRRFSNNTNEPSMILGKQAKEEIEKIKNINRLNH